jgi:glutaredoxin
VTGLKSESVPGFIPESCPDSFRNADRIDLGIAPALPRNPHKTIVVEGSDAAGAFYGALDLAEQIGRAQGEEFVKQIKPVTKSPYLQIRGVNTAWDFDIEEIASAISKVVRSFAGRKRFRVADLVESVSNAL